MSRGKRDRVPLSSRFTLKEFSFIEIITKKILHLFINRIPLIFCYHTQDFYILFSVILFVRVVYQKMEKKSAFTIFLSFN